MREIRFIWCLTLWISLISLVINCNSSNDTPSYYNHIFPYYKEGKFGLVLGNGMQISPIKYDFIAVSDLSAQIIALKGDSVYHFSYKKEILQLDSIQLISYFEKNISTKCNCAIGDHSDTFIVNNNLKEVKVDLTNGVVRTLYNETTVRIDSIIGFHSYNLLENADYNTLDSLSRTPNKIEIYKAHHNIEDMQIVFFYLNQSFQCPMQSLINFYYCSPVIRL